MPFRILSLILCALLAGPLTAPAKTHVSLENRVWNFFQSSPVFASESPAQVPEPHRESGCCGYDFASGVHNYLYAHNNPVNRIDPSGNESIISVVSSFAIRAYLRTSQFVAVHPVYTALGGIVASVAFPQLEAIPPGHPSPLDEMGQVGRIIRQGIAKGLARVTMNNHHPLPKFLGGDRIQNFIRLPRNVHEAYHKILHERRQAKGFPLGGLGRSGN